MGWLKPKEKKDEAKEEEEEEAPKFYQLWTDEDQVSCLLLLDVWIQNVFICILV